MMRHRRLVMGNGVMRCNDLMVSYSVMRSRDNFMVINSDVRHRRLVMGYGVMWCSDFVMSNSVVRSLMADYFMHFCVVLTLMMQYWCLNLVRSWFLMNWSLVMNWLSMMRGNAVVINCSYMCGGDCRMWCLMVHSRGDSVVNRCFMMDRRSMVNRCFMMDRRSMVYRCFVVNRSSMMDRGCMMDWSCMVDRGWMVSLDYRVVNWSFVVYRRNFMM